MVGPIGYWTELQAYQIGALLKLGLKPHHRLLDIGCGPLRGGLGFIDYLDAGNYAGIDLSEACIAEAHMQIAREGLASKNPFLAVSDSFGWKELNGRRFDYIWCSQLLYHLDEKQVDSLLQRAAHFLAPRGRFYGDIIGYPNAVKEDSQWNGFRFYLHTVDVLKDIAARHLLDVTPKGQIEDYGYPSQIRLKTNALLECSRKEIQHELWQPVHSENPYGEPLFMPQCMQCGQQGPADGQSFLSRDSGKAPGTRISIRAPMVSWRR